MNKDVLLNRAASIGAMQMPFLVEHAFFGSIGFSIINILVLWWLTLCLVFILVKAFGYQVSKTFTKEMYYMLLFISVVAGFVGGATMATATFQFCWLINGFVFIACFWMMRRLWEAE